MLPERDGQRRAVLYGGIEVSSQVIQVCIQKYKGRCQVKIPVNTCRFRPPPPL